MRINALTLGGLGVLGWFLYETFKNKAQAGVKPIASAATLPYTNGASIPYSPAALNASVPGVSFAPSSYDPAILTSTLTGSPAVTGNQVAAAASFWSTLMPVNPPDSGYITFPSGSQAAAATFVNGNTRMDSGGTYYVLWGGQVYQLGQMDSAGNWPALPVSG